MFERRRKSLDDERSTWDPHWRDISSYIMPRRGRFLGQKYEHNKGTKKNDSIVASKATRAAGIAAAGMKSLANKGSRWFVLSTADSALYEWGPVKQWLWNSEQVLYNVFAASNFYDTSTTVFEELVNFGTATLYIEKDWQSVIRCYPFTCGSYSLALDSNLRPDTIYRTAVFTAAQLVEKFGEDKVSSAVKTAWMDSSTEQTFEIIHAIEPNDKRMKGKVDNQNMPWRSVYYDPQDDPDRMLRESGYHTFPVCAPRWWITGNDVYGTAPAMVALPDVRQYQKDMRRKGKLIEMIVNPPMVAPTSMKTQRVSTVPGDVTFVDTQTGGQRFEPAWVANHDIRPLLEDLDRLERDIDEAFYVDVFKMIASRVSPEMTATQVMELAGEKMLLAGPVIERAEGEYLDKAIDLALGIVLEAEILPPPPPELMSAGYTVKYISPLSLARLASGATGLEDVARFAAGLGEAFPDALSKFDARQAIDEYARMKAIPPSVIRTDEAVAKMDAVAQQQAQAMQAMEMAKQGAGAVKDLSQSQMGDGNVLEALSGVGR